MPLLLRFDSDHDIHHISATGASTLNDWQECLARAAENATAVARTSILLEFTAEAAPPHDWEIPLLAFVLREIARHRLCRIAILASAPQHGVALAMLAFSCDAPGRIHLCDSLDHAHGWLARGRP